MEFNNTCTAKQCRLIGRRNRLGQELKLMAWTIWIFLGALFGGTGVGFGAFGAHALRNIILNEHLQVFETAVRYQMYHAFVLLFTGLLCLRADHPLLHAAGVLFSLGIVAFSGSLYAIVLADSVSLDSLHR